MQNCGLSSLEKMTTINEVSMFSLIHLAKDNGLNLYFCKVEPDELVNVARPAIFHQKDHFVFIKNGAAMPPGEYDGYVLTPRPLHEPLPFSLAKKIRGRKNIGSILQPIAIGITSLINPMLGAVVGAGFGAATAAGAFGDQGKGEWWRIGTGGLSGALGASNPALSALSAAAGEVPGAIKSGNWMTPLGAGIGQYGANIFASGAVPGFQNAPAGTNLLGKASAGFEGGVQQLQVGEMKKSVRSLAGGQPSGGGVELARSASIPTPAGYSGSYTLPGIGSNVVGLPGQGPLGLGGSSAARLASGTVSTAPAASSGFDLSKILGTGSKMASLGVLASTAIAPPEMDFTPQENLSKASQFLGNENFTALPKSTRTQLEKYVNTPLDQLTQEFMKGTDKQVNDLALKKKQAIDAISVQYASYGQDPYTSTEAQQKITEITRQYDQAEVEIKQQAQNQALQEAITFKKDILGKSMEQGEFDYNAAMELATYYGLEQQYRYALESKNYDALQSLLAEIFSMSK